jgi:hypothetical protein
MRGALRAMGRRVFRPRVVRELRFWAYFIFVLLYILVLIICGIAAHEAMNLGL